MLLSNSIEIPGTAQPNQIRGLLDEEKLLKLLEIINTNSLWGKKVLATLLVVRQTLDRKVLITCSSSEFLHAPVAPYGFDVESKLGVENLGDSRSIPYVGEGQGRVLTKNKLGKNYYFVLSKRFEVDEKMRGFDCSSFVGSAFHIAPEDPPGGPTSSVYRKNETLVQAIGVDSAKTHTVANTTECKVNLEELPLGKITGDAGMKKLPATLKSKSGSNCTIELKTSIGDVSTLTVPAKRVSEERKTTTAEVFFKEHPSGTYIAHSSGHFVLVKNGELHEFNSHLPRDKGRAVWAQKGYFHQAASTWSGWGAAGPFTRPTRIFEDGGLAHPFAISDPRLPTLRGFRRLGTMQLAAIGFDSATDHLAVGNPHCETHSLDSHLSKTAKGGAASVVWR